MSGACVACYVLPRLPVLCADAPGTVLIPAEREKTVSYSSTQRPKLVSGQMPRNRDYWLGDRIRDLLQFNCLEDLEVVVQWLGGGSGQCAWGKLRK